MALLALGCLLILRPFISAGLWGSDSVLYHLAAIFPPGADGPWTPRAGGVNSNPGAGRHNRCTLAHSRLDAGQQPDGLSRRHREAVQGRPPGPPNWIKDVPLVGSRLSDYWLTLAQSSAARLEQLAKLLPTVKTLALEGGKLIGSGIVQILLRLFIAFFFYRDGDTLAAQLSAGIYRTGGERGDDLLVLAGATMRAVVYGTIGTALIQV